MSNNENPMQLIIHGEISDEMTKFRTVDFNYLTDNPMPKQTQKPTVIFDFDGVIHSYNSGWKGANVIPDEPVDGIREVITDIRKEFKVVVVSSRCYLHGGIPAIKAWLDKYNILVDDVTGEKPPAIVQIDDRAITFDGNPSTLLEKIKTFKPWNK